MMIHDCRNPDWIRKVFRFIEGFLDTSSGPVLQRTSGTTGDPGEFELMREAMEASALKTLWFFKLAPGDRVLLCLPVDYIAGKMMVVRALVGGLDLVLTEPSSRPLKSVEGQFRFVPMVPLQLMESLKEGDDLSRIAVLLIGGAELSALLKDEVAKFSTPEVYESFGMSETYTHFALRRINGPDPEASFRLLSGARIHCDDRGCLVVNLPGVTRGEVVTNDLVEISDGGQGFTWLGRYDNVINTGGIKVIPEILEEKMGKILGTTLLLLPLRDEKLGQKMVLLAEWDEPGSGVSQDEIIARWKHRLGENFSPHELPRQIFLHPRLPRNASYKPDRRAAGALLEKYYFF